jgi:hypothetical protein
MKRQHRNVIIVASLIAFSALCTGTSAILGGNLVLAIIAGVLEAACLVLLVFEIVKYRAAP